MTDKKLIVKICQRCGAPLVQRGKDSYCEYCKTSYQLIDFEREERKTTISRFVPDNQPQKPFPNPPPLPISSPYSSLPKKKKKNNWIFFTILAFLFMVYVFLFGETQPKEILSDANLQTEREIYQMNSVGRADEFPASFIHNSDLSLGAILDTVSRRELEINFYAKNNLNRNIVADVQEDRLVVTTVEVKDDLGNQYICEVWNDFDNSFDEMEPGEIEKIAQLDCTPGTLPAEAQSLSVHAFFTNWGDYTFQIPLKLDVSMLTIDYRLTQYEGGFYVKPTIYSSKPQYIMILYDDIFVVDDQGEYYILDYCSSSLSTEADAESRHLFIDMAGPHEPGSYFSCYYKKSIPADVSSITFGMSIRGNVVTHLFPVDTQN